MISQLKKRLNQEAYLTSYLSIFINPFFIIRHGLYKNIVKVAPQISGRVLDFGCGTKPYESIFSSANEYIGVDIESAGADHKSGKVDVFYDGKTLPFPDAYFDAIVSFEVFEHVFNLDEILRELHRVLKPGGTLLFTVPFAWDEHMAPYDYARYTSYGVTHLLHKHNLEITMLKKTTTYVLACAQMFIAYLSQHVLTKRKYFRHFLLLTIIFPLNLLALALNRLLPKRYEYFCNIISIAKKKN